MKFRIGSIGHNDSYYPQRKELVGKTGTFKPHGDSSTGYVSGEFTLDNPIVIEGVPYTEISFYKVAVVELPEPA